MILTVLFADPLWVGVFKCDRPGYAVCRIVLGLGPNPGGVLNFVRERARDLLFSVPANQDSATF